MLKSECPRGRRGRISLAGAVLVVSLGVWGQSAQAGDSNKANARAHYETATRLYEIREYDKALLKYKSAYLAHPDPAFLFNIGQCYRKLGQDDEALNFFQQYLKKAPPEDPNRRQVQARIRDIETEAKLKAKAVQAAPALSSPTPLPNPPPPASAPMPTSSPGPSPTPTAAGAPPAAASLEPVAQVSAAPQSSHPGRGLRIAGIACGAAGLASFGIAIYYYTQARSFSDKVNSPTLQASDDQAGRDAQTMQWVFYSVGAGALATGTLLYLLGWPSAETGRSVAGVTPMLGPGLAGISAQGRF
jgi:tetratricopeptide (TPR) repeat protein